MFLFSKAESGNASISSPKSFCCTIRPQKCITLRSWACCNAWLMLTVALRQLPAQRTTELAVKVFLYPKHLSTHCYHNGYATLCILFPKYILNLFSQQFHKLFSSRTLLNLLLLLHY